MIHVFEQIEKVEAQLIIYSKQKKISNYRIILSVYGSLSVYIIGLVDESILNYLTIKYPIICFTNIKDDEFDLYESFFKTKNKVIIEDSRIQLSNLLDQKVSKPNFLGIPIVTFYSYKGGVGRSTTLAACATSLSILKGLKVVILDCDFEAPGINNFFMEDPDHITYKNGLVEYFMDTKSNDNLPLNNYYWEVSIKFSGKGNIFVFSAGNLNITDRIGNRYSTHFEHYLNGLTHLDIFSKDVLFNQLLTLMKRVKDELNPDIVLIDSRTGLNDIFGITAYRLSDIVVGFFGSDAQNRPGVEFFLNSITRESAPYLLLAHSIVPADQKIRLTRHFTEYVQSRLAEITKENNKKNLPKNDLGSYHINIYPISYNEVLRNQGKPIDSYEEYINMIKSQDFSDYRVLFDKIYEISQSLKDEITNSEKDIENIKVLKRTILERSNNNLPKLYAEDVEDFEEELISKRYFFRTCMDDLFNMDKFLVLGNKGTGKTYIYRSLDNGKVVEALQTHANKTSYSYRFIQVINKSHYFDTIKLDLIKPKSNVLFYERFWTIYIWNAIMAATPFGYRTNLEIRTITDSTEVAKYFEQKIFDNDFVSSIEQDLQHLDSYLSSHVSKGRLVFIFDELDRIVRPNQWSERIAPLINLCRKMTFANISPKIFLRSDLFEKLDNLNNKNNLKNQAINIEWTREELFSYFFKFVFSHSKEEFLVLMQLYGYYPASQTKVIAEKLKETDEQPPLDSIILRRLSATFFGKYADYNNTPKYGESYDWFFTNLKNANDTISLRPFIDLRSNSLIQAIAKDSTDYKPILSPRFYTNSNIRAKAVERHFKDMSSEEGNKNLEVIFDFIQKKAPTRLKKDQLVIKDFNELLDLIIQEGNLKEDQDKEEMISMMIVNGIIRERFIKLSTGHNTSCYQFALLYKYYLGLRSKNR